MPLLSDSTKQLSQQIEVLRQTRSKNAALIEERLRVFTRDSNVNTSMKKHPEPEAEQKFRSFVDNTVALMGRYSINKLKRRIELQRELELR